MSQDLTRTGEGLFTQARRGYDRDQVDSYVAQLQQQVRELQSELQRRTADVAVEQALDQVGTEVADILKQANTTREGILATAQREADELRLQAEQHAAHVTSVAEERVRKLDEDTDRIWTERQRIVADARDLSSQLAAVAEMAAQRFPEDPDEDAELVDGVPDVVSESDADEVTEGAELELAADQGAGLDERSAGA